MSRTLDDRIARLPKWAQDYIEGLEKRIDEGDIVDLSPGGVNYITPTRKERKSAKMVERGVITSMAFAAWRKVNQG